MIDLFLAAADPVQRNILELFIAGGGGALLGTIATRLIDGAMTRGVRKTDAAKALTEATVDFTSAVTELNHNLHEEVVALKRAIVVLTDTIDELLPLVEMPVELRSRLLAANTAAKLTL